MTVLACGLATLDVVQTVERVPGPDEKVVATDLHVAAGGPAANAAATAAALGVPARLLTRVGDAGPAALVLADLQRAGVEVHDLAGPGAGPAVSTVLVTRATGERAVVSVNARAAGAPGPVDPAAVDRALQGVTAVLVDGHHLDLALAVARRAGPRGVPVLLDGGSWKPGLEALLPLVDVALLSADLRLPEDLVAAGRAHGAAADDVVGGTRVAGARSAGRSRGALPLDAVARDGERLEVPVRTVAVVDTLGAGDVLHGALAAWVAVRAEDPATAAALHASLVFATRAATAACTAPGARGWVADPVIVGPLREALHP